MFFWKEGKINDEEVAHNLDLSYIDLRKKISKFSDLILFYQNLQECISLLLRFDLHSSNQF